ncbi:hypothetical protein [Agathobaculum sp. Marseille-P7918]|uniref:hypothetical protein n=1 Tax=Agathobaculum sp. Marseille-P7918 TaxID=2479843 RepID=UPI000F63515A|nr:hypothetical protein [Agathobaculum sp. Marseille-P7918]
MKKTKFTDQREPLPRHRRVSRTPARCTSGSQKSATFAHSHKAATSDHSPALPIRSVLVEDKQMEILRAIRTVGVAAKRGWRTLARIRQDGFSPAHIGCAAGSQPRAHTLRVTGICPALRSPRTHGAAVLAAHAATNANQKFNRDRADSSPFPFPIPA